MSMLQGSSGTRISGGTSNAIEGDQINSHIYIYSGEKCTPLPLLQCSYYVEGDHYSIADNNCERRLSSSD